MVGKYFTGLVLSVLLFCLIDHASAQAADHYQRVSGLAGAQQIGPSCAFFANVPALTYTSGINITDGSAESMAFIKSIYGLRKGDFKFRGAYDRATFFAMFGIHAQACTEYYRGNSKRVIEAQSLDHITAKIQPALSRGHFVSIRVTGSMGRPHNLLLLAYRDGKFLYHNPTTGKLHTTNKQQLSRRILTKSTRNKRLAKPSYFISYHVVHLPEVPPVSEPAGVSLLSSRLAVSLSPRQLSRLSKALQPAIPSNRDELSFENFVKKYPGVSWIAISRKGKLEHPIHPRLTAAQHSGIIHIARFTLHSYQRKNRTILPVMVIDNRPHVLLACQGTTFTLHNGIQSLEMNAQRILDGLKNSRVKLGYLALPR